VRSHVRTHLGRVPVTAWLCAAVALLNGVAWSLITPPLHVPDENSHLAYTQYLAETGNLPVRTPGVPSHSDELNALLASLRFYEVIGRVNNRPPITPQDTAAIRRIEQQNLRRVAADANNATDNPPLYYLLASVPYLLTPSGDLLDRLVLMRLLSALLMALTTITVFLFVREIVPSAPWTWTVAGLLVALEPMAGFMAGGVTPDPLLFLTSALTILAAARCLRRGLTPANGVFLALATAASVLTKPLGLGLIPGAVVALLAALLVSREQRSLRWRGALGALGAAAAVAGLYFLITSTVLERTAEAAVQEIGPGGGDPLTQRLSYIWQLFLPRLPFQVDLIAGFPLKDIWLPQLLGQFGWLDYGFSPWIDTVFFWVCLVLLGLGIAALVRFRRQATARVLELVTYTAFGAGVLFAIGWPDYRARTQGLALFEQGRYLLPLLAIFAGVVAVALKGLGPRLGRPIGALLVIAMLGASILGQLLTLERFYG